MAHCESVRLTAVFQVSVQLDLFVDGRAGSAAVAPSTKDRTRAACRGCAWLHRVQHAAWPAAVAHGPLDSGSLPWLCALCAAAARMYLLWGGRGPILPLRAARQKVRGRRGGSNSAPTKPHPTPPAAHSLCTCRVAGATAWLETAADGTGPTAYLLGHAADAIDRGLAVVIRRQGASPAVRAWRAHVVIHDSIMTLWV